MSQLVAAPRVVVVAGDFDQKVATLFAIRGWHVTTAMAGADLVCFTGGADVSPSLYGELKLPTTHPWPQRDAGESEIFKRVRQMGKPLVGICRGAQILNVLSGGKMVQDVDNHTGTFHAIKEIDLNAPVDRWRMILSASDHHQMMVPGIKGNLVAVANKSTYWAYGDGTVTEIDSSKRHWDNPEVVFYPETRSLCYQPHPENGHLPERNYFFELLFRYFGLRAGPPETQWRAPNFTGKPESVPDGTPFDDDIGLGKDPVG